MAQRIFKYSSSSTYFTVTKGIGREFRRIRGKRENVVAAAYTQCPMPPVFRASARQQICIKQLQRGVSFCRFPFSFPPPLLSCLAALLDTWRNYAALILLLESELSHVPWFTMVSSHSLLDPTLRAIPHFFHTSR